MKRQRSGNLKGEKKEEEEQLQKEVGR